MKSTIDITTSPLSFHPYNRVQSINNLKNENKLIIDSFSQKAKNVKLNQKLNIEEALLYRDRMSLKMKFDSSNSSFYSLNMSNEEFSKYGIGLFLYFDFFKKILIIFFVMSLISLIPLIRNNQGNGLTHDNSFLYLQGFSLANLVKFNLNNQTLINWANSTDPELQEKFFKSNEYIDYIIYSKESFIYLLIPDVVYTLIFFEFVKYLQSNSKRIIKKHKSKYFSITSYALEVSGFPSTVREEEKLKMHFEKFGPVLECKLARNYFGTLKMMMEGAKNEFKFRMEEKRCERNLNRSLKRKNTYFKRILKEDIKITKTLEQQSKQNLTKIDDYPSIKAFIIFHEKSTVDYIKNEYKKYSYLRRVLSCKEKSNLPSYFIYEKIYPLTIKFPEKPSNIKWENIDCPLLDKVKRRILIFLLVMTLLIITFLALTILIAIQSIKTKPSCLSQESESFFELVNSDLKNIDIACICNSLSFFTMLSDSNVKSQCADEYNERSWEYMISLVCTIIITFINFGLRKLLQTVQEYCRYDSMTKQSLSLFNNLFISTFINSSFLITIVSANIFEFIPMKLLSIVIPSLFNDFTENLANFPNDFNRIWYQNVGSKIQLFTLIQAFIPHLFFLMFLPIKQFFTLKKMKKVLLQRDLNELMVGESFDLTLKYTRLLGVIFICFIYSSGMPFLLIIATFTLTTQYLSDKYLILRYCKKPIVYDETLHKDVLNKVPLAIIIHLMFGIYCYGCPSIFPNEVGIYVFDSFSEKPSLNSNNDVFFFEIFRRLKKSLPLSLVLIYVITYYFMHLTIVNIVRKAKKAFKFNKIFDTTSVSIKKISEVKKKVHDLDSYDIKKNMIYFPLIEELEKFKIIQPGESPRSTATRRLNERKSILKPQISIDNLRQSTESFYENYWDFNAFKEIQNEENQILEKKNDENERNQYEEVPKTSKETKETTLNHSNQFLKINRDEYPTREKLNAIETHHKNLEDPKILEFIGETESKQLDPDSRNSLNLASDFSPLRNFSLLKHSLMNNLYKTKSILHVKPVPLFREPEEPLEGEEPIVESIKFNKLFESQEKKRNEIIKKKENIKEVNILEGSSRILVFPSDSQSNIQSPDRKLLTEVRNDNENFIKSPNSKSYFFTKNGTEIISPKPSLIYASDSLKNETQNERLSLSPLKSSNSIMISSNNLCHLQSPLPNENNNPMKISDFKDYLKKYDKKELFQNNSSAEIEMFGSEKLIQRKRENEMNQKSNISLNISVESYSESPLNQRKVFDNLLKKNSTTFKILTRNAKNVIIPIEEIKKLEDDQTQTPLPHFIPRSTRNQANKTINEQNDIMEQGSNLLKSYLNQVKKEYKNNSLIDNSMEKKQNNLSKSNISDSFEFAVVKKNRKSIEEEEGGLFTFIPIKNKKTNLKIGSKK